ncbi:hypothetical protein LX36DRAFT_738511 [Colletotrichum falcatum]|nr:hypothetical protein LX36DRAFT_738511 [Colletotrichum falcatum]
MPYTPPSQSRSPASSAPSSPDISRRSSFQSSPRPSLPRSASYLTKHRRTPAAATDAPSNTSSDQPTPPGTSDDLKGLATSSSVRQSPPPLTDERGMPKGAIISPPDSGSEEEDAAERGRQIENLKELQEAISQIPVKREASPTRSKLEQPALALITKEDLPKEGLPTSFSTSSLDALAKTVARRATHIRSSTEPRIVYEPVSATGSESDSDGNNRTDSKPPMVRKKSGELVRPALRPASARRRPSSMPGTPTFSKAVHFDSHLEHVRHFLQVDRPLAVSAGSSPVDNYDSDTEYPFPGDERRGARTPPFEWEIVMANQPVDTPIRKSLPVRLERVWLSPDQKNLLGSVAVANLAFQKFVTCRFTLDYWKTTSEVAAEYSHEIRPHDGPVSQDRFAFTIKLSDLANLETKTLFFCIKYSVNGQDFWDNNNGTNFQVDFRKKYLPQNGKRGLQGAASRPALPRSNRRSGPAASAPRPKSMPVGFDDFPNQSKLNFEQPIHEYLGESGPTGLRLKVNKSTGNLASDNLPSRLSAPSGQAFANRYDFGASLTAAVQAAKDTTVKDRNPDGLYMKSHRKIQVPADQPQLPQQTKPAPVPVRSAPAAPKAAVRPTVPGTDSPNAILASSSYEELVNKYCFFGSKQSSPQIKDGTMRSGKFDGPDDGVATRASNSTSSSSNGSPSMSHQAQHAGPAQHHAFHIPDSNPYFYHHPLGAYGASPASSPLGNTNLQQPERPANQRPSQASTQPTIRSASSAASTGGFPFAGTSPNEFPYAQQLQERFPFNTETHAATAIRG